MKQLSSMRKQIDHFQTGKLKVKNEQTNEETEIKIYENKFIKAVDLKKLKLRTYDPGLKNTIICTSKITFIDGERGVLQYRGYPIEELCKRSSFLEVSYLLIKGHLPTKSQFQTWRSKILSHTYLNEDLGNVMKQFRYNAHPMGMLITAMAAYSTLHPEANPSLTSTSIYKDEKLLNKQIYRIIGTLPTIAANAYRHRQGRNYNFPDNQLGYVENFLAMLDKLGNEKMKPHPVITKAFEVLFIIHADHEQNCSTSALRHLISSGVDIYSAIAGSIAALYGPSHGGANAAVLKMLEEIATPKNIPKFI